MSSYTTPRDVTGRGDRSALAADVGIDRPPTSRDISGMAVVWSARPSSVGRTRAAPSSVPPGSLGRIARPCTLWRHARCQPAGSLPRGAWTPPVHRPGACASVPLSHSSECADDDRVGRALRAGDVLEKQCGLGAQSQPTERRYPMSRIPARWFRGLDPARGLQSPHHTTGSTRPGRRIPELDRTQRALREWQGTLRLHGHRAGCLRSAPP
jgi:hypothetical protein